MDASNPVMSKDRATVSEILERSVKRKRQDLAYLGEVARTAPRVLLECKPQIPPLEARQIVARFKESIPVISKERNGELDPQVFERILPEMPVCGILDASGIPLHPPGVQQSGGSVNVTRQFGQTPGVPLGLAQVAEVFGEEVLKRKHVYTSGTWAGFSERLKEQMSRKTVPLAKEMARSRGTKALHTSVMVEQLDKWMPRDPNKNWPGLHTNLAEALHDGIKVTSTASAGAPYWRKKGECMEHIVDVGLPIFVNAIKENKLPELWKMNPEMFLCEVKNKLDRYKVDELDRKTRPYVGVPAHISFLISMATQGFQETLHTFDRDSRSSNAYGFCSANGGLGRMVDWMRAADKRGRVCAYGDDARIAVRRDGEVWIVDPDFKQMDGSIDQQDINLTVDWVISHMERDLGEYSPFWRSVGELWKKMACDPVFVVDGKGVYVKKHKNGLMTGIPGTTLFDTVKSVATWNLYLDEAYRMGYDPLDEARAVAFMKRNGLVIKPGTWNPAPVPESRHRQVMTDHKFLGMQILCLDWMHQWIYVPTLPEQEALEMLVVQKDNPYEKESATVKQRRLYDRMRGLFTTVGFSIRSVREAIHNVVNQLEPTVIIMDTQNPFGEQPDHITLQEMNYPDSSGFPSVEWCYNLYSGLLNPTVGWTSLFPTLGPLLQALKAERREIGRDLRWAIVRNNDNTLSVQAEELVPPPLPEPLKEAYCAERAQVPPFREVNPRSYVFSYREDKEIPRKYIPSQAQVVLTILEEVAATQVGTLMDQTGLGPHKILSIAKQYGLYMTGVEVDDIISRHPLATPFPTLQEDLQAQWVQNADRIDKGTSSRQKALTERALTMLRTSPQEVYLDVGCFVNLQGLRPPQDAADALRQLHIPLGVLTGGMRWRSRPPCPQEVNPISVYLEVGGPGRWTRVAEARSVSKKLAKEYIAGAIFNINGIPVESTKYTVTRNPPKDSTSWADQVDMESPPGPLQKPAVVDITEEPPDLDEWRKRFPEVPRQLFSPLWKYALRENSQSPYTVFERLLKVRTGFEQPQEEFEFYSSVRSRMSTAQKKRQNRRLLERRKRKRRAQSGSSSSKDTPPSHDQKQQIKKE